MRQKMTLFDEISVEGEWQAYAAVDEGIRASGFRNGARTPIGYRIVEAGQRGAKIKKRPERPDPAETVRRIYRMALDGVNNNGPMGLNAIVTWLNAHNIRTRDGGRASNSDRRDAKVFDIFSRAALIHTTALGRPARAPHGPARCRQRRASDSNWLGHVPPVFLSSYRLAIRNSGPIDVPALIPSAQR